MKEIAYNVTLGHRRHSEGFALHKKIKNKKKMKKKMVHWTCWHIGREPLRMSNLKEREQ